MSSKKPKQKNLPAQKEQTLIARQISMEGPIPAPVIMAQYDQIVPGAANRILQMAEKQQDANISLTERNIALDEKSSSRGFAFAVIQQIAAFLIILAILSAGIYFVKENNDLKSYGLLVTYLAGLAGLFLHSKKGKNP